LPTLLRKDTKASSCARKPQTSSKTLYVIHTNVERGRPIEVGQSPAGRSLTSLPEGE
jgi:hypothetical protein